jgi:hypothetical protein
LTYINLETTSRLSKHPLKFNFLETFKNEKKYILRAVSGAVLENKPLKTV